MIISHDDSLTIERSEQFKQNAFTIRPSREAFEILSGGLYQDRILAVIRELSTNAYDAHVAAELNGIKDRSKRPFDVTLPSKLNPIFKIRDYGTGLSESDIFNIYTTYFGSTKQDSNDFIGALGLGSKSPFSIVSSFLVISFFNNIKTVYSAIIGEDGFPSIVKMHAEPTSGENGIEINVTVGSQDIQNFYNRAQIVYQHFTVRPNFIGIGPTFTKIEYRNQGTKWAVGERSSAGNSGALQGQVRYDVSSSALEGKIAANLLQLYNQVHYQFYFFFNIGEVDIQASREALSYTPRTIAAIEAVLQNCKDELYTQVVNRISKATSYINAVYECNSLVNYEKTVILGNVPKWKNRDIVSQFVITDTFTSIRGQESTVGFLPKQANSTPIYQYTSYVVPFKRISGYGDVRSVSTSIAYGSDKIIYDPKYPDAVSCAFSRTSDITLTATPYILDAFEVVLNDGKLPLYKLREYLKTNMNDRKEYFIVDLKNESFVKNIKDQFGVSTHICTKDWVVDVDRVKNIKSVRLFTGREYKQDYYNKFSVTSGFTSASDINDLDSSKVKYYVVSKGSAYNFPDVFPNIKSKTDAKWLNNVVYCFYRLGILPDRQQIVVVSHSTLDEFQALFPKIKPLSDILKLKWSNLKSESQVAISDYLSYNSITSKDIESRPLDIFGQESNFLSWLNKNTKNTNNTDMQKWAKTHFDTLQQLYFTLSKKSVYTESYYNDVLPIIKHMFGKLKHTQTNDIAKVSLIKSEILAVFPMFSFIKDRFKCYSWQTDFSSVLGNTDTVVDYLEWDWNNFKGTKS